MRHVWIGLCALLVGCGNSISGQVDGEGVGGAREAIFESIEISIPFIGDTTFLLLILSDIPNGCQSIETLFEAPSGNCEDACENYVDYRENTLSRDDYWSLFVSAIGDDDLVREYRLDDAPEEGEFSASFSRLDFGAARDQATCEDECTEGSEIVKTEEDQGNAGTFEVTSQEPDALKGKFEINFGGDDALSGSFKATRCPIGDILDL